MGEITDSIKKPVKALFGTMASIGAGALIGVAIKYIPRNQLGPIAKFCAGIGASGIALAVGEASRRAIEDSVDRAFVAADVFEAVADGIQGAKEQMSSNKTEEPDEFEDDENDVEPA